MSRKCRTLFLCHLIFLARPSHTPLSALNNSSSSSHPNPDVPAKIFQFFHVSLNHVHLFRQEESSTTPSPL
ncbi:hypothetical protein V1523DRAFT_408639 [Lipomyces doorenjongii]